MVEDIKKMTKEEIDAQKRKQQMAILKASNQMLNEAMEKALKKTSDPVKQNELANQFKNAIEENKIKAKTYLHATLEEIENSQYKEVDPLEVEKYKKRLEKRHITDEQMHQKAMPSVIMGKKQDNGIVRRKRRTNKKELDEDYQKIDNEEELMRMTMVNDDSQIQKSIEKNREFEQQMHKDGKDIVKKIQKTFEDETMNKKINVENNIQPEHIEIKNNIQEMEKISTTNVKKTNKKKQKDEEVLKYDFDFASIPSYIQYDVLPLPSKGQCYPIDSPLRCGRVPVAYLTASDENIIASPNVYRDGKLLDIILGRKILDKRINIYDLTTGDRDAIILWLRGTSYGEEFPILVTNPDTNKQYNITINLSQFDYLPFDLEGDENGLFDFVTSGGDLIKFKFFTSIDEEKLRKTITSQITDMNKIDIIQKIGFITETIGKMEFSDEEKNMLNEDIDEIKTIVGKDFEENTENIYPNTITEQMILHTVSINGNEDREFIRNYIENMRTKNAMEYRNYFVNNQPGVDFNFSVQIPESDGGGSFETFLRIDDTIFINF